MIEKIVFIAGVLAPVFVIGLVAAPLDTRSFIILSFCIIIMFLSSCYWATQSFLKWLFSQGDGDFHKRE